MHVVAMDEAGNTGQNLLDPEQPIFALASILLTEQEADHLVAHAQRRSGGEVKFSSLRRSRDGRRRVLELLRSPLLTSETVKVAAYHKRFALCAHLVDLLVEPVAHRDGLDLYEGGVTHGLAELLWRTAPVLLGSRSWDRLLRDFQGLVRNRDAEAVARFYSTARRLWRAAEDAGDNVADLLVLPLASERMIDEILAGVGPTTTDPAISSFFSHCAAWTKDLGVPFDVLHDSSKPIAHDETFLRTLMRAEEPVFEFAGIALPLLCRELTFVASEAHPRVQIADVVASAAAYSLTRVIQDRQNSFAEELGELLDGLMTEVVWPLGLLWPDQLAEQHPPGTERLLDAIMAVSSGKTLDPADE